MTSTMNPYEGVSSPDLHLAADAPQSWNGSTPMTTSAVGPYGEPGPQQLCLGGATSTTTPMTMPSTVGPYGEPGPGKWNQIAAAQRPSQTEPYNVLPIPLAHARFILPHHFASYQLIRYLD